MRLFTNDIFKTDKDPENSANAEGGAFYCLVEMLPEFRDSAVGTELREEVESPSGNFNRSCFHRILLLVHLLQVAAFRAGVEDADFPEFDARHQGVRSESFGLRILVSTAISQIAAWYKQEGLKDLTWLRQGKSE